jgi:hypothetical protein
MNRKMSHQEYNYYGQYEDNSRKFSYSLQDIYSNHVEKEKYRMRIYENILAKCYKKIKDMSLHEETFCFFTLPEYLPGHPLYNMTQCVQYILNSLHDKGFHARYVDPFMIFITWSFPKVDLRRKEKPMLEDMARPPVYQSQPPPTSQIRHKPIENASTTQFFYRKI